MVSFHWASAPDAEKAGRSATTEAIRWFRWGMRSYQSFNVAPDFARGTPLFVFTVIWAASIPRLITFLMAEVLSGVWITWLVVVA